MMQLSTTQVKGGKDGLPDNWNFLKSFTNARIALGRTATSVPLKDSLDLKLAHANARDAVYSAIDIHSLLNELKLLNLPVLLVRSKAKNRNEYLQRPDLGRQLDLNSSEQLSGLSSRGFNLVVIIADGLSAKAINEYAVNLLRLLVSKLHGAGITIAPVIVAQNARVALGDETGELLKAELSLVLIGERPGLSCADGLGAYLTYSPKAGLTDEVRNCVSNICLQGLQYEAAVDKIFYLIQQALKRKLTGVRLKDEMTVFIE